MLKVYLRSRYSAFKLGNSRQTYLRQMGGKEVRRDGGRASCNVPLRKRYGNKSFVDDAGNFRSGHTSQESAQRQCGDNSVFGVRRLVPRRGVPLLP